ncbi:MAG: LysR family transcriptional regulator [Pseudomonadota bacterium]
MISLKSMQAFVTLAEKSNFADAAEKLFITQPALSTAIKNMETQLGGKLFARSTRKVALTPEGTEFLPVAQRLIQDWDIAIADIQSKFSMQRGSLAIAAMPSFAESILPKYLNEYHLAFPDIRIRVLDIVMEDVIKSVEEGRAELGFVFEPEQRVNVDFVPIMRDSFIVIMRPSHPLASASQLAMQDVMHFPLVTMNKGSTFRLWIDNAYAAYQKQPNIIAETFQLGTLGQLLNQSTHDPELAIGIVPQLCQQQMERKGLMCIELTESMLKRDVGLVMPVRKPLSTAAMSFLDMIVNKPS